jgi:hypothetical protein
MQTEKVELYFRQGSSDKVYHLKLENVQDRIRAGAGAPRYLCLRRRLRAENAVEAFAILNKDQHP